MNEFVFPIGDGVNLGIDGDSRKPSRGVVLLRKLTANMPKEIRQNLQLAKHGLESLARGEMPALSYPVRMNRVEHNKGAIFAANNSAELWYLRHHGDEVSYLKEFLETVEAEPNCIVFDIGGYIGYWSIFAALQPGVRKVYTFEPNPITRNHLIHNIKINKLEDKVDVFSDAVSATTGKKQIYFNVPIDGGSSFVQDGRCHQAWVNTISVDKFCQKIGVKPNIIKVDVEGAEGLVFEGMSQLLQSNRKPTHIFLELHPRFLENFQTWPTEVINYLTKNVYQPVSVRARNNGTLQCHFALK